MLCASDLMSPEPLVVSGDTPLEVCARRLNDIGRRHLVVVGPDGELTGVVTDAAVHRHGMVLGGDFIFFDLDVGLTAHDLAVPAQVVVHPNDDAPSLLRRLARSPQDWIVVTNERDHPVGLVTEHALLEMASLVVPSFLTVDRLPRQRVITFGQTDLASLAMDAMRENHVRHVPVTGADGRLLGVVSYRDLIEADVPRRAVFLDEVRSIGAFTATPGEPLVGCVQRMLEHHVGCLPVVEGDAVVRMVTRRDLLDIAAAGLEDEGLFEDDGPTVSPEAR